MGGEDRRWWRADETQLDSGKEARQARSHVLHNRPEARNKDVRGERACGLRGSIGAVTVPREMGAPRQDIL